MKKRKINEEVLYADEPIVRLDNRDVKWLVNQSNLTERKRIRICTHKDIEDRIHEMIIVHTKDTYVRPHKHLNKIESFHIIEGLADVVIYGDDGTISDIIPMGEYRTDGRFFYYRLSDPLFHTLRILSDYLIFHEITQGPFRISETEFASWSPGEKNIDAQKKFMEDLAVSVGNFVKRK